MIYSLLLSSKGGNMFWSHLSAGYVMWTVLKKSSIPKNTMDKSDRQKVWWMFWFHFVSILRPDDAAGCPGHSGGEEVAGDSHKRGEPERREEGWGLPLVVPRSGEQEREEGDPGLWTGQSKRHHGAGRVRAKMALTSIHLQKCMRKLQYYLDMLWTSLLQW